MRAALATLLLLAAHLQATSYKEAPALAYKDACRLPAKDRPYVRYLWWPKSWQHARILTKGQQAFLSDQGKFPNPVEVAPGLFRIDARESGWDKRFQVWERFAGTDVFFHAKWKFLEDAVVNVYFPAGDYDGKRFGFGHSERTVRAGDTLDRPALWGNPPVDLGDGVVGKAQDELRKMLHTEAPILMGPWFLTQTQRQISIRNEEEGTGYNDFLGIKDRNDFFRLTGLDEKKAVELYQEWRAVVEDSGISQQNRQVVALRGVTGVTWGTLDVFKQKGQGVAKRNLRRGEFKANAEEWIGPKADGLPVMALIDAATGKAVASAPDKIGPDDSPLNPTRDKRVHNGISCFRCHGVDRDFIKPFDDWVRRQHQKNKALLVDPDKKVLLELESAYLRDIQRLAASSRGEFAYAFAQLTSAGPGDPGLTVAGFTRIYAEAWNRYVHEPVTLEAACEEIGADPKTMVGRLADYQRKRGKSDTVLGVFLDEPSGKMTRLDWEDTVALAAAVYYGYATPEVFERREKK
jgi:hypothetical protein